MTRYRGTVAGATSLVLRAGRPHGHLPGRAAARLGRRPTARPARTPCPARLPPLPETGNGGYGSLHTDVHMVYDAAANRFLPGNHVTSATGPRSA